MDTTTSALVQSMAVYEAHMVDGKPPAPPRIDSTLCIEPSTVTPSSSDETPTTHITATSHATQHIIIFTRPTIFKLDDDTCVAVWRSAAKVESCMLPDCASVHCELSFRVVVCLAVKARAKFFVTCDDRTLNGALHPKR